MSYNNWDKSILNKQMKSKINYIMKNLDSISINSIRAMDTCKYIISVISGINHDDYKHKDIHNIFIIYVIVSGILEDKIYMDKTILNNLNNDVTELPHNVVTALGFTKTMVGLKDIVNSNIELDYMLIDEFILRR